jgi:uncharacterized protein YjbI with pentapeptide repeats
MHYFPTRTKPKPWGVFRREPRHVWATPFVYFEWCLAWAAWGLGNWAFLEVLEYLGRFSVAIAVILYFTESGDRLKQKHFQAWQVINTAQGKGGSGGRIEALQDLNGDHVPLIGIEVSGAFLQGLSVRKGMLDRCDLSGSDLRNSDFAQTSLAFCNLQNSNLRQANLSGSLALDTEMEGADLQGANLTGADLTRANLDGVDLRGCEMRDIRWKGIQSMRLANLFGARNLSPDLLKFATDHGAVLVESDEQWSHLLENADMNSRSSNKATKYKK